MFLWYTLELLKNGHSCHPARALRALELLVADGAPQWGIARTYLPSFVENGPKLRVLILAKWEWPETAKNRGEPWKMILSSERILVICPVDKNRDSKTKNWLWAQNIQIFGSTFSSLAANWNRTGQGFQHERGVSLVPWYEVIKKFTPSPPKKCFLAK